MSSTQPQNCRSIAVEAFSRGWMDIGAVWDAAVRYADQGGDATADSVFHGALESHQLSAITDDSEGMAPTAIAVQMTLTHPRTLQSSEMCAQLPSNFVLRPADAEAASREKNLDLRLERTADTAREARYVVGDALGRGGSGEVVAALDREVGRTVALKTLRSGVRATRGETSSFLREARITGQLEHPGIIPVHDLGALPDGQPYYTMPIVKHRSLREIVQQPPPRAGWPLARLCNVLAQVCRAVDYAHARGIIHRDLKPDNILIGDFGEVYVADWGLASIVDETNRDTAPPADESPATSRDVARLQGTPSYMSPEQIGGVESEIDHRSDLFSLGCILYEILTGQRAFSGDTTFLTIVATTEDDPIRPREVVATAPLVLEDLCMSLLAKNRRDRPASAGAVAIEIEAFLEGAKEKQRRRTEADRLVAQANAPVQRYLAADGERARLTISARALMDEIESFDPIDAKLPAWKLEDDAQAVEVEQAKALSAAIDCYSRALGHDPEHGAARSGLAALYWSLALRGEAQHREGTRILYQSLVAEYDDGQYAAILSAPARVSLRTHTDGAEVVAFRYTEQRRTLRPIDGRHLGVTPLSEVELNPGNYLFVVKHPKYRDVKYPIVCRRGEHHRAVVNLYTDAEIGEDFVYVPAGRCTVGGDDLAFDSLPRQELEIGDFAISRFPVTFAEYLAFINDLAQRDPQQAERRLPHLTGHDEFAVVRDGDGRWVPDWEHFIEGDGRRFCPREKVGELPVSMVNWFDAVAYCAWLSQRDSASYRLVEEIEWEKAARGVDGRCFPWGDRFDATFCKMRHSRPGFSQTEPVGAFSADESVYGARDLAGSMRCWTADLHGELSSQAALAEGEPTGPARRDEVGMRGARGGTWLHLEIHSRAASRYRHFTMNRDTLLGIRIARSLSR